MSRHRSDSVARSNATVMFTRGRVVAALVSVLLVMPSCRNAARRVTVVSKRPPFVSDVGDRLDLAPGLSYRRATCGPSSTVFRELRLAPTSDLEVRVLRNPTAHRDPSCLERYGGADILALAAGIQHFEVLAFVNGNFFHDLAGGFASNGLVWSAGEGGVAGLVAPVESTLDPDYRGDHLAVIDHARATDLRFSTTACEPGPCRSRITWTLGTSSRDAAQDLDDSGLVAALRTAYPGMTAALQLTPAFDRPDACESPSCEAVTSNYLECAPEHRWTCGPHSVTFLCIHADHGVSLIAAEKAMYAPLATAMREGGTCGTDCAMLYLLDGGGSTQLGVRGPHDGNLRMVYAGKFDPSPPHGCPTFRPVDHYLVIGRSSR